MQRCLKIALILSILLWTPIQGLAQEGSESACETDFIVEQGDELGRIAELFFGNVLAYPAIFIATNTEALRDDRYPLIADPDIIELDWRLCIPPATKAEALLNTESASFLLAFTQDRSTATTTDAIGTALSFADASALYADEAATMSNRAADAATASAESARDAASSVSRC